MTGLPDVLGRTFRRWKRLGKSVISTANSRMARHMEDDDGRKLVTEMGHDQGLGRLHRQRVLNNLVLEHLSQNVAGDSIAKFVSDVPNHDAPPL